MVSSGKISGKTAKEVLDKAWDLGPMADPPAIVEEEGLEQVTDMGAIEKAVDEVIAANPEKAEQAKLKPALAGWFVGQVMKATGGKASPQAVNDLLKKKLGIE
jgi:aspartyl-tRNA(Asn)/glutamyl-tRNA(Gln) amidotransferase subunit B